MLLMNKKSRNKKSSQDRFVFESLEERTLYSAGVEGALMADLQPDIIYQDINHNTVLVPSNDISSHPLTEHEASITELVVVDISVPDHQRFIDDIVSQQGHEQDIHILTIDSRHDDLASLSIRLEQYNSLSALHLISHGAPGELQIGQTVLSLDTVDLWQEELSQWASALSQDGDILIYGCDVASSEHGQRLVERLANYTQADVAASDDLTGHARFGADWDLEFQLGTIESQTLLSTDFVEHWTHTLDITSDLVGHWAFEDGTGTTATDQTGNQNGTIFNAATWNGSAAIGNYSLDFSTDSGGNSYVEILDNAAQDIGNQDFTISFWYNQNGSVTGTAHFVGQDDLSFLNAGIQIYGTGSNIAFQLSDGSSTSSTSIAGDFDGQWHMVSISWDESASEARIFHDGAFVSTLSSGIGNIDTAAAFTIGAGDGSSDDADASIDDVRIYTRELSDADIIELYNHNGTNQSPAIATNSGITVSEGGTVAITNSHLNEGDPDDAGSELTYTVTNGLASGDLELTTNPGVSITTFTQDDIDNNRVIYAHDGSESASDSFEFSLADGGENGATAATGTFAITVTAVNDAPSDLSSGIELNTDGGNDAYLIANDGGAILGGLGQFSIEIQFATDDTTSFTPLFSYASPTNDNELAFVFAGDDAYLYIADDDILLNSIDYRTLRDGSLQNLAVTWDNTAGYWAVYSNGELIESGSGHEVGNTIEAGGELIFGNEQDSLGGSFQSNQAFQGSLYNIRIWNDVRTEAEIALHYQQTFDAQNLPDGLIADWQMDGFNGANEIVERVSGNNLTVGHAAGVGFTSSTPTGDLRVTENATNGTSIGFLVPSDADVAIDIVDDGLFLESGVTTYTEYTTGQTFGGWTVDSGSIGVEALWARSPLGGMAIDLAGSNPGAISQELNTEVGRQYQVVFALTGNFTSGFATQESLRVTAGSTTLDATYNEPDDWSTTNLLWDQRSLTFTASSTTTTLSFQDLGANSLGSVIGDVQVYEIPAAVTTILNNDGSLSYDAATGKFYRYVTEWETWADAQTAAVSAQLNGISGQLVTIGSAYENDVVWSLHNGGPWGIWLGGSDQENEGHWRWYEGTTAGELFWHGDDTGSAQNGNYTNFYQYQPDDFNGTQDDLFQSSDTGFWDDSTTGGSAYYVIEWDASQVLSNFTFALTDDANGRFAIDNSTGELTVADGSQLDYESAASHDITVAVTDANGDTYSEVVTISVDDLFLAVADSYNVSEESTLSINAPGLLSNDYISTPEVSGNIVLGFDATADTDGNGVWSSNIGSASLTLDTGVSYTTSPDNAPSGITAAFDLNGPGGIVSSALHSYPEVDGTQSATLETWILIDAIGGSQIIFDTGNSLDTGITLVLNGGWLDLHVGNSGFLTSDSVTNPLSSSTWHHLALTVDMSGGTPQVTLYVDGTQQLQVDSALSNWGPGGFGLGAVNGSSVGGYSGNVTGQIAHFRIHDQVLSTTAISDNAANPDAGTEGAFVASFDDSATLGTVSVNSDGSFTYDPNGQFDYWAAGQSAEDTFTYAYDDGNGVQEEATVTITINGTNDAPVITSGPGGGTHNEGTSGTYFNNSLVLSDVDSTDFDGGQITVTVTNNGETGDRLLVRDGNNVTVSGSDIQYDFGGGPIVVGTFSGGDGTNPLVISLNNNTNVAAVQAVAQQVAFRSEIDNPSTLQRTLTMQITDGDSGTSNTATCVMNVIAQNDTPTFGGDSTDSVTEDVDPNTNTLLETSGTLTISDPDGPAESSFQAATISGAYGDLTIDSAGNWSYTADNTQSAIQSLDAGESISDVITVSAYDGTTTTVTISLHGAEDTPTLDNTIADQTATEDSAFSFTFAVNTFSDVDASDILTYSAQLVGGGSLPSWLNFDGNTRTFSGTPTNGDVGTVSIEVIAHDGAVSATESFDITINGINDLPTVSVPASLPDATEQLSLSLLGQFSVGDVDSEANDVFVLLETTEGVFNLTTGDSGVDITNNGTGSISLSGTITEINALLSGSSTGTLDYFNGSDNPSANATITLSIDDQGNTGTDTTEIDLVGRYTFDGGNANDTGTEGTAQDGILVGGANTIIDGDRGEVLNLDAAGEYVRIDDLYSHPANVTLAAWVNYSTLAVNGGEVLSLGNDVAIRINDGAQGVTAYFYDGSSHQFIGTGSNMAANEWHHVAFSFDDINNTQTLYIDGVAVATQNFTESISWTGWFPQTTLGTHADLTDSSFDLQGRIDEARVYNRVLSSEEIQRLAGENYISDRAYSLFSKRSA